MAMVPVEEYFSARLCARGDLGIINKIMDNLDVYNQKRFRESCFGQFVDFGNMQLQGQLYLHMLFKQDSSSNFKDELVFHINNQMAHFGRKEFALITGLHFGEKCSIPQESSLHSRTFKGMTKVTLKDIENAFFMACQKKEKELSFKLALLWVLFGILIPKGHTSKKIEGQYIHLADDLITFNNYPWGRVAFEFLVSEFRASMGNRTSVNYARVQQKERGWRCHLDAYGFCWVIQVWAYEAIPSVAKLCATRKGKSRASTPRMLHWNANGAIRFDELTTYCFPIIKKGDKSAEHMKVMEHLVASRGEVNTAYYQALVKWEESLATGQSSPSPTMQNRKRRRYNVASTSTTFDGDRKWRSYVKNQFKILDKKVGKLHKLMVSIKNNLGKQGINSGKSISHESESFDERDASENSGNDLSAGASENSGDEAEDVEEGSAGEEEHGKGDDSKENSMESEHTMEKDESDKDLEIGVQKLKEEGGMQLVPYVEGANDMETVDAHKLLNYNPIVDHVPKSKIKLFAKWWKSNQNTRETIAPTISVIPVVTAQWFNPIWSPDGWLNGEHIDALMHLVMCKVKKCVPVDAQKKFTFVDLNFLAKVTSGVFDIWEKAVKAKKGNADWLWSEHAKSAFYHVEGSLPSNGYGMPWCEAEYVYGVANINNSHWVLYELIITDRNIMVYDSLGGTRPPARQGSLFRRLASVLPSICREGKVFDDRDPSVSSKKAWSIERYERTPQQTNSSDCGIMCIKMFECLAFGKSIHTIDPHACPKYRQNYCAELFHKDTICAF